ncbi:MAG: UDP-N-acetylglucosamine 1-carboxyvinyltransferase [Phycisphaeraceae bacterium]
MDAFVIQGEKRLRGTVRVHGSKNASLPLMAAALLTDEPVVLHDVPELSDIASMASLLEALGCTVARDPATRSLRLTAGDAGPSLAHYDVMRKMRAGICVLGPLLARRGRAKVSMPGGCAIGDRPVDLHLRGLRALGAEITLDEGYILAETPPAGLRGAHVFLGGPNGSTVLGTANILCAATLARGRTIIECAACEPEIEDLARLLTAMGGRIAGAGTPRITIDGVHALHGAEHQVIPDRIEAGTYVMAAAITNGDVVLENFPTATLAALIDRLDEIGVELEALDSGSGFGQPGFASNGHHPNGNGNGNGGHPAPTATLPPEPRSRIPEPDLSPLRATVRVAAARRLRPVHVVTQPYPGFPTDLQAQIMALLSIADGNSIITEKIFPDRFLHVAELARMGASLTRSGPTVLVAGTRQLIGAPVMASDLRASAGLVLAALAARGTTTINRVYHLDRGYERMELTLQELGADIERVDAAAV